MNEKNEFALVPRPPSEIEKVEPGAKRVLSGMVSDTLALAKKELPRKSRPLRIVMVNDEPGVLQIFEIVIRDWFKDATMLFFDDGATALEELVQTDPDLLITDDKMAVMSGGELCEHLLDRKVTYPIIVVSSVGLSDQWVREFANRGLNVSLLDGPPFDLESFLKAVETALKIPRTIARPDAETPQVIADTELENWFQRGEKYRLGRNVPKDYTEALKWYRKAAEQGNAKAQEWVGVFLILGMGIARDEQEALKWFSKSVRQGNSGAACFVGEFYIENDYAEAYKWLTIAKEQGDERAASGLKTLQSWMSPQDLLEGKRRIREFRAQDVLQ